MYMKVRALSSEGRMSAKVLTALPIGTFALVFMINPGFYLEYSKDPTFIIGFSALIALYLLGAFIIRKMVDLKV
jgi:tight adherence protein B